MLISNKWIKQIIFFRVNISFWTDVSFLTSLWSYFLVFSPYFYCLTICILKGTLGPFCNLNRFAPLRYIEHMPFWDTNWNFSCCRFLKSLKRGLSFYFFSLAEMHGGNWRNISCWYISKYSTLFDPEGSRKSGWSGYVYYIS